MVHEKFTTYETAWCPGCGDFNILRALNETLNEMELKPHEVLVVGGIGQAAKLPQYINANGFCGLHGRAVPAAVAAKIVNQSLKVIIHSGDGDTYGEGGNHFIHNIRRNVDIAHFVHDNQIYGLTKGQASPTTATGQKTSVQTLGNLNTPLNPLALALVLGAGFVARTFSGDMQQLKTIMKEAIEFKGYALVDILQPCLSFNKVNTFSWYKNRVRPLDSTYDHTNLMLAIEKSLEWGDQIPTGILYKQEKVTYHEQVPFLNEGVDLIDVPHSKETVKSFLKDFS